MIRKIDLDYKKFHDAWECFNYNLILNNTHFEMTEEEFNTVKETVVDWLSHGCKLLQLERDEQYKTIVAPPSFFDDLSADENL